MPQERLTIDNISSQTNFTGSITDIDDDPDSPDGLWITTINGGSNIVRPTGLSGTWAGGSATDIDEVTPNDADYIYSEDRTNATGSVTFAEIADIASTGTCTLRLRHAQSDGGVAPSSGGNTSRIESIAVEGVTVWSTGVDTGSSFQDLIIAFDASLITPSGTFQVDIVYTGGGGGPVNRRGIAISWMEFEYPYHIPDFRGQFQNPSKILKTGPDLQEFRALIRRSSANSGPNGGNTIGFDIQLRENGGFISTIASGTQASGASDTVYSGTWRSSDVVNRNNVEIGIVQTSGATGVTTADRRYLDIGAVEWNAELSGAKVIFIS